MTLPIKGFFFREFNQTYMPEILTEIYRDRVYDQFLKDKKDLTIVDLGANIGLWTFYAHDKAKVLYSVEPAREHFECLATMIITNGMDNVVPIQKAVSNTNGSVRLGHSDNKTMHSLLGAVNTVVNSIVNIKDAKDEEYEDVQSTTLDKLFKDNGIKHVDFMKIDIEGTEVELFAGEGFDKVKDKIDVIVGEFHSWTGSNPEQLANCLKDKGFKFEWINKAEATLFSAERIK
jgi:FkbM family methyltransferase